MPMTKRERTRKTEAEGLLREAADRLRQSVVPANFVLADRIDAFLEGGHAAKDRKDNRPTSPKPLRGGLGS
jgi:hypothetical protein